MRLQLRLRMRTLSFLSLASAGVLALAMPHARAADPAVPPAPSAMELPHYTDAGKLAFPSGYREWQFVTAGHGMNYNELVDAPADPPFDNVFVQRAAYAAFKRTGHWPEGTMLVLEIRPGSSKGSINKHGAFQHGAPVAIEMHVRDERMPDGWAFYGFGGAHEPAAKIPTSASCYACHRAHGAVDTTFVQFYPTLLPIARAKGTLSAAYRAEVESAGAQGK